ncbi:MAG: 6-bladed beta-propeller [Nitrospirae bacterium]|nr:6-bladed beta-propeller [Nitrospirota bacterium]
MSRKTEWLTFVLFLTLSLIVSCAPTYQKPNIDMVWPLPPDEPRIRYVDTIRSTLDVGKKTGVADALFGEEKVDAMAKPYGVAVDKQGVIYVSDPGKVFLFDLKNKSYDFIGTEAGIGKLSFPVGMSFSEDGRLFVTDISQDRVFVYRGKKYAGVFGQKGELESPSGVAVDDKRGVLYVVDSKKHYVAVYSLKDSNLIRTIGSRGTAEGQFNYPSNITIDAEGKLYVVDTGNFRVQVFDAQGKFLRKIGQLGDLPGTLARPKGVAVDSEGHIYVVDTAFSNFQIFDQEGHILLSVGGPGDPPGKFWLPAGIAIDHDDKIYVVDQYPGVVQIFQYLGKKFDKSRETKEAGEKKKSP